jgi:hypothetical protein
MKKKNTKSQSSRSTEACLSNNSPDKGGGVNCYLVRRLILRSSDSTYSYNIHIEQQGGPKSGIVKGSTNLPSVPSVVNFLK